MAIPLPNENIEQKIPPLENGDRLSRAEFERRYNAMPNLKKAELIEGVVFMPSPVRHQQHGHPHSCLITWLGTFEAHTSDVQTSDNSTLRLELNNEPQPDAVLLKVPPRHGNAIISEDGYIEGAPEIIAEVAASTVSLAANAKFHIYERAGVQEYIIWRIQNQAIDWFILQDGHYERLSADADGVFKSRVLPGLWLDPHALLNGDMKSVLSVLNKGLQSEEHEAFESGGQ